MSLSLSILSIVPLSYATVLNNTITHEYAVSSSCTGMRSLRDIVTSCITTLFACAWTAIHPNMPGPAEGGVAVGIRRLGVMLLVLLAPELIVMWAVRQHFAARMVQQRFQNALRDGTFELRVKPFHEPSIVSRNVPYDTDEIKITIPEKVTKGWSERLVLLYSSIYATFRRTPHVHERLGPSLVSVESLKSYYHWTLKHSFYAWMGGFMLIIDKDPALPCEVYHPLTPNELFEFLQEDLVQMSMVSEKDIDDRSKGDWLSKIVAIMQLGWFVIQLAARSFEQLPTTQLEIDTLAISILSCFSYAFWWDKPKDVWHPAPVYWKKPGEPPDIQYSSPQGADEFLCQLGFSKQKRLRQLANTIVLRPAGNLGGIHCVSDAAVKARRVPYFCGYPAVVDRETLRGDLPVIIIGGLVGMVFGGVHCIAWNFDYPTHIEQILWRIASLTMTAMPGFAAVLVTYAFLLFDGKTTPYSTTVASFAYCIILLYSTFRLIMIVLMFLSLRSPPVGVYDKVCWTSIIPHL